MCTRGYDDVCVCVWLCLKVVPAAVSSSCDKTVNRLLEVLEELLISFGMLLNHQRVWCGCQVCKLVSLV